MKKAILLITLVATTGYLFAQKKTTTSGIIKFDATTSLDQLPKAENKTVIAAIDTKKGTLAFEVIIKNFSFSNPKMQDHFNGAGWLDSEKFPTAVFKGTINNLASIDFSRSGTYTAEVSGELTMHGNTKPVSATGKIVVNGNIISTNADFVIKLEDYGINGPAMGSGKVSKEPKISVSADMH